MKRAKMVALIGLLAVPAAAFTYGGWAVITVEDLPEYAVAGTPVSISYTVRRHGVEPLRDLVGELAASSGEAAATGGVSGVLGVAGRYKGTLTFPAAGQWDVQVKTGFGQLDLLPITVVAKGAPPPSPMAPAKRGEQLFVAKGCVTCHTHQLTKGYRSMSIGPDLTEPKFMSAYLTKFLADPSIKTNWANTNRMPNVGLKPAEITALVAFLNKEGK